MSIASDKIERLKSMGLQINNPDKAERYFDHLGNYGFDIYSEAFQKFEDGVSFENIISLYQADRKLRSLVFDAMCPIEDAILAAVIEYDGYQNIIKKGKRPSIGQLANRLDKLSKEKNDEKNERAKDIANAVGFPSSTILTKWLYSMREIRNICAHHNSLWNHTFPDNIELMLSFKEIFNNNHNKFYAQALIINRFMVQFPDESNWIDKLKEIIDSWPRPIATMGFPKDWWYKIDNKWRLFVVRFDERCKKCSVIIKSTLGRHRFPDDDNKKMLLRDIECPKCHAIIRECEGIREEIDNNDTKLLDTTPLLFLPL